MHSLRRSLIDYDMAMLRALAENRGVELTTNRQVDAADRLAVGLLDSLSARAAVARLSAAGREALDTLLAAEGHMRAPHFARQFGSLRAVGPGRLEREAPWREPANAHEELYYLALVFHGFFEHPGGPGEFVFVPDDVVALLPHSDLIPPSFSVELVPAPSQGSSSGPDLVEDLFTYLVYVQNHDVRLYADGRLTKRDLAALHRRLGGAPDRRLALARRLADRLGFVLRQDGIVRLQAGPVKQWLSARAADRQAALQAAWRDDAEWNDLCQVPGLQCDRAVPWHPEQDPVATRRAILALLALCPAGDWWSLASFVSAVKTYHPDFQRPDGDYTGWYIRDTASGDYLSGFDAWDQVEGALLADLLTGPMQWLGIVATSANETDPVCCLTPAGARFLDLAPGETEAGPSLPIVVAADFSIEVPPPANLYTCFQVERFAIPLASPQSRSSESRPRRYRLTVESLGRALARGVRGDQVLAFLRQATAGRVPPNVAAQIQVWAGRFGRVQLDEVALLRVQSEQVLKELSVLPETRSLIGRILSAKSALIRRRDLPRLRKELRALGYLAPEENIDEPPQPD